MEVRSEVQVPLDVRLHFGRAAVQVVASHIGVDIVHIKGDAVDPSLRTYRHGSDVDILVRPEQVDRFDAAIRAEGWRIYSSFELGSPFGHAQTYLHSFWGYLDVHRTFPGIRIDDARAFEVVARDARVMEISGVECQVPTVFTQAALLILNAARAGGAQHPDMSLLWEKATRDDRTKIRAVVAELHAEVAFSASVGGLDHYRGRPDYQLWKVISEKGSRAAEWRARVRAAPTWQEALRVIALAPRVNTERLTHVLGRKPTRREVFVATMERPARAILEARRSARRQKS